MWKRFDNDVKRMTHLFEEIFIDPFDNCNLCDHPLNFASCVVTTSAIKESLLNALDKGSLYEEAFDTIREQHATKKLLQLTPQV